MTLLKYIAAIWIFGVILHETGHVDTAVFILLVLYIGDKVIRSKGH